MVSIIIEYRKNRPMARPLRLMRIEINKAKFEQQLRDKDVLFIEAAELQQVSIRSLLGRNENLQQERDFLREKLTSLAGASRKIHEGLAMLDGVVSQPPKPVERVSSVSSSDVNPDELSEAGSRQRVFAKSVSRGIRSRALDQGLFADKSAKHASSELDPRCASAPKRQREESSDKDSTASQDGYSSN